MKIVLFALMFGLTSVAFALPAAEKAGGMPLRDALTARKSTHRVEGDKPSDQQLANLLWAANGVTRKDGKRTAPSAMDRREIQVNVLTADGLFRYDAVKHDLTAVKTSEDLDPIRKKASALLIYTYDKNIQPRDAALADCGFVGQNVYLYCASENWKTVFIGTLERKALAKALGCAEDEVLFGQRVGM